MVYFREVQRFRQPWLIAIWLGMLLLFGYRLYQQLVLRQPGGDRPLSDAALIAVSAGVLLFAVWFFKVRLVTEVRDRELFLQFVWMWRPRIVALADIRQAEAVTYRPIRDYGGWGIRRRRKGWAYNVSGNRGVRIVLADGEHLLVGSRRAEELARSLEDRMMVRG